MLVLGNTGCIRGKVVVFGESGSIWVKVFVFGQSCWFRQKWLYSGKSGSIGAK